MPTAFMIPISLKSSPIEKLIENLKTRNDTIMRQMLKITTTNAMIRFMTYAILSDAVRSEYSIPSRTDTAELTASGSSVVI